MPTKKKTPKKQVIQHHHITYKPEWIVPVTKGEHYVVTQLQRFGAFTVGARKAIEFILASKALRPLPVNEVAAGDE